MATAGTPVGATFSEILRQALVPNPAVRGPAETQLRELEHSNYPVYLYNLCDRLGDAGENTDVRQLAGLMLKNTFDARDEQTRLFMTQRWLMLRDEERNTIKEKVLAILHSDVKEARSVASQAVAKIAGIEVPRRHWDQFTNVIFANLQPECTSAVKESSLEVLQFVAEEIGDILRNKSGDVLAVIAASLQTPDLIVKHAAAKALGSVLEICEVNMQNPTERGLIMEMIFSIAQDGENKIKLRAFEALVKIGTLYYAHLPEFIEGIMSMTQWAITEALKGGYEPLGLQAIEFWSSVSEVELDLQEVNAIALKRTGKPQEQMFNLIFTAFPKLFPGLCECLTKQSDEVGDETWNLFAAAGDFIDRSSQVIRDPIVNMVLPFIQENIKNPEWRIRDAAIVTFGAILGGPDSDKLQVLIGQALGTIVQHVQDESLHVRDSAIWTIGRICEFSPESLSSNIMGPVLEVLATCLQREPRIAALSCWALHNLAVSMGTDFVDSQTSPLSKFFQPVVSSLFGAAQREDADEANLCSAAFESMNLLVSNASKDCVPVIQQLFMAILSKMQALGQSGEGAELQGYLCSSLQACLARIPEDLIAQSADHIMVLLLSVLQNENALLYEEALMAVGSVINAVKGNFKAYIGAFRPYLMAALRNVQDQQVNIIAVSVVSDLTTALGPEIAPLCDEIMTIFLQNLQSQMLDREAKPIIISALGDIALATTTHFVRYLQYVMMVLLQASQTQIQQSADSFQIEFVNSLRLSILEALIGIITGLREGRAIESFNNYVEPTIQFLDLVANDGAHDEAVVRAALGLLGDLFAGFGKFSNQFIQHPCVAGLLYIGEQYDDDQEIKENVSYVHQMMEQIAQ
eukprot:TRINITY_DN2086_c0_g1_i1.p1 TRINITY_DN2086_c0_g1~~TRINITY_DN2086_c0_g1_i1.p1  ORF type:complete len:900 (-),score=266.46 TRINITY_DN2086_c0_g1_i1:47-2629(-)